MIHREARSDRNSFQFSRSRPHGLKEPGDADSEAHCGRKSRRNKRALIANPGCKPRRGNRSHRRRGIGLGLLSVVMFEERLGGGGLSRPKGCVNGMRAGLPIGSGLDVEAVADERFGNESNQTFHRGGSKFLARGCLVGGQQAGVVCNATLIM
ncbi:MAG: hypothetical protein C5B58_05270 [Acidobacteria bacterium]|nr:MAG: hypothetical protein C5B58_05270 [Acidobacteriota bacterium]